MNATVADIIAQTPAWADAQDLTVEPIGGLTNTNYLVTVNGERFVVRLSGRNGALPVELETYLLECYFGQTSSARQARLEGMKFMALFFTAMWGLLQYGMQMAGMIPRYDDFDCLAYAQETFATMSEIPV